MAVQPDPPIQLDPSQDQGHQLAFINQNFLSLSNFIQSNSFPIASRGTTTITASAGSGVAGTITHNLGIVPIVLATVVTPFQPQSVPFPYLVNPSSATTFVIGNIIAIDTSVVTFNISLGASATGYAGNWLISYYLISQRVI